MADDVNPAQNEVPGQEPVSEPTTPAEGAAEVTAEADAGAAAGDQGRRGGGARGRGDRGQARTRGRSGPEGEGSDVEENVVKVYRCATVVKGGRRFSFAALVVVGDRRGRVGIGYGKANEVPNAVEKATKAARRNMVRVNLDGTTIPHPVTAKFGASTVKLIPAGEGTGVIAGASVRAVLELAGVKDVLTKCYGSTSPKNLVRAAFAGLQVLRTRAEVARARQVELAS